MNFGLLPFLLPLFFVILQAYVDKDPGHCAAFDQVW